AGEEDGLPVLIHRDLLPSMQKARRILNFSNERRRVLFGFAISAITRSSYSRKPKTGFFHP
ncbi:MAG: hypothetical protein LBD02_08815, partial [Christensenellaceae bacterium]|nr:hypothetical protein [Christensenellaceae bacterium]